MATKLAALLRHGRFIIGTAGTLVVLCSFTGCDQDLSIDPFLVEQGGSAGPAAGGAGGAVIGTSGGAGLTSIVEPGTGGTTPTTTALGGAGGQPETPTPIPAACAPISTTPGVVSPCGHAFGVAYSPDGRFLAIGSDNAHPSVRVWGLADGMPLPDLPGQGRETTYGVAFSPDGKLLAAAGYTGNGGSDSNVPWVRLWDLATGTLVRTLRTDTGWYAASVAFSSDGSLLLSGGYNGAVELWRVADGTRLLSIPVPTTAHNVHFSPDDSKLIIATVDGKARVYDSASGALVLAPLDIASEMADATMSPDGTAIATTWQSGNENNSVRIYDATTGALLQSLAGHAAYISHVVWIDQNRIVSGDWRGQVILWQRGADGAFAQASTWSTGGQSLGIGVSPDKTTIVTGGAAGSGSGSGFVFIKL